jgi:glutamine amidotransferase PdxT
MGSAWRETVVTLVTEFGRTARINGSNGTDHGTATVALLVGGESTEVRQLIRQMSMANPIWGRLASIFPSRAPCLKYLRDETPYLQVRGHLRGD